MAHFLTLKKIGLDNIPCKWNNKDMKQTDGIFATQGKFKDLANGEIFSEAGSTVAFMKIEHFEGDQFNAVCMVDGSQFVFEENEDILHFPNAAFSL